MREELIIEYGCEFCGRSLLPPVISPLQRVVPNKPANWCESCDRITGIGKAARFQWPAELRHLFSTRCNESEFEALRRSPEMFLRKTMNPRLEADMVGAVTIDNTTSPPTLVLEAWS